MIGATTSRYLLDSEKRSLFDIVLRTANSLAKCIAGDARDPEIPNRLIPRVEEVTMRRGVRRVEADEVRAAVAAGQELLYGCGRGLP